MLTPLYCRSVDAFFGMASGALAAAVPQGWTQGTRQASGFGDDPVGDFVIEGRPVLTGARASSVV